MKPRNISKTNKFKSQTVVGGPKKRLNIQNVTNLKPWLVGYNGKAPEVIPVKVVAKCSMATNCYGRNALRKAEVIQNPLTGRKEGDVLSECKKASLVKKLNELLKRFFRSSRHNENFQDQTAEQTRSPGKRSHSLGSTSSHHKTSR